MTLAERLAEAISHDDFVMLVLSRSVSDTAGAHKVTVRPVEVREGRRYQWITRVGVQERHENLTAETFTQRAGQAFGTAFGDVHVFTKRADITGRSQGRGRVKWKTKPPAKTAPETTTHNREKQYLIPAGQPCPFLQRMGVMTPTGQVRATMSAKFRQINRYLEFIDDIFPALPTEGPIRVVDFGCGKSYLTFALHHFLTAVKGREVRITGLDLKADVITDCTLAAQELNCAGLKFRAGDIASYQPSGPVDLAISLHACDTATDDAIAAAIAWQCRAILAVPCCQHEIHQQLHTTAVPGLTDFGLFRERFAAMLTDSLRAQYLESRGYKTQILEFIDMEHTPKNVLIRAVKRADANPKADAAALEKITGIKRQFGIETWKLEANGTPYERGGVSPLNVCDQKLTPRSGD